MNIITNEAAFRSTRHNVDPKYQNMMRKAVTICNIQFKVKEQNLKQSQE